MKRFFRSAIAAKPMRPTVSVDGRAGTSSVRKPGATDEGGSDGILYPSRAAAKELRLACGGAGRNMIDESTFVALINAIYDAAVDFTRWPDALRLISSLC